jgi:hypothetical protein
MKRGVSIVLVFMILTAMFHITVATHFCGGNVAATKVSLTGKMASCGMETSERKSPLSGASFTSHCCDDVVNYYGTNSDYTPSFLLISESYQSNFQFFGMPAGYLVNNPAVLKSTFTDASPPGALTSTDVDLAGICVFRI